MGAVVVVAGLYLVVWGKSKDYYDSPSTLIQDQDQHGKEIMIATNEELGGDRV